LNVYDSSSIIVNLVGGISYGDKEYVVEVQMEGLKKGLANATHLSDRKTHLLLSWPHGYHGSMASVRPL
jgi:hypothetical protein